MNMAYFLDMTVGVLPVNGGDQTICDDAHGAYTDREHKHGLQCTTDCCQNAMSDVSLMVYHRAMGLSRDLRLKSQTRKAEQHVRYNIGARIDLRARPCYCASPPGAQLMDTARTLPRGDTASPGAPL